MSASSLYLTSLPGQLSLAIPPWVDAMPFTPQRDNTSPVSVVLKCGWGEALHCLLFTVQLIVTCCSLLLTVGTNYFLTFTYFSHQFYADELCQFSTDSADICGVCKNVFYVATFL